MYTDATGGGIGPCPVATFWGAVTLQSIDAVSSDTVIYVLEAFAALAALREADYDIS